MYEQMRSMDKKRLGYITRILMPEEISNDQLAEFHSGGKNLNTLSYEAAFGVLLRIFKMGFKVKRIICD